MLLYNTKQVSEGLGVSEETIRRWIRLGDLDAENLGKSYRIVEEKLREFLVKKNIDFKKIPLFNLNCDSENMNEQYNDKMVDEFADEHNVLIREHNNKYESTNKLIESPVAIELPVVPMVLNTSENDITKEFYDKCLQWARKFDRGVGFFTSGWIRLNAIGMSKFAANGGKARWMISPIMDGRDVEAIKSGLKEQERNEHYKVLLKTNLELISEFLEKETLNAISWMVYDNIIEFRFAIPVKNLDGDFHDKFGIFSDDKGNKISFNGSMNDSQKGFSNYESIKVFTTWNGNEDFVNDDEKRFERLWDNRDENVDIFKLPEAIKEDIFQLRSGERPYKKFKQQKTTSFRWRHQDEAIQIFLSKRNGVLEIATGAGKTKISIEIINLLLQNGEISTVIITVNGTDLLDQWYKILIKNTSLKIYRYYASYKELGGFLLNPKNSIMLVSRTPDFLDATLNRIKKSIAENCIIICDEVHGFGSPTLVKLFKGKISPIKYRLGLSATPEREYDDEGNKFIEDEIGKVIYTFGIDDAIKRGILCELKYYPLDFELTQEDRTEMKKLIASFHARKQAGQIVVDKDFYTQLSAIKKVSPAKIPIFKQFVDNNPNILNRCIIFVETKEFGIDIQNVIINYITDYHTYYGDDDRDNLVKFAKGEIRCLITCKRISEGIDIQSVNNIILLSADRAKLQTIQRIGRCLRIDPFNSEKKAEVVDFICVNSKENVTDKDTNSDIERKEWLLQLSNIRREE